MNAPKGRKARTRRWVGLLGPPLALVVVCTLSALWSEPGVQRAINSVWGSLGWGEAFSSIPDRNTFLRPENLLNILRQASPVGIVAVGMTLVIVSGAIDLSVGSLVALAGGVGLLIMNWAGAKGAAPSGAMAAGIATIFLVGAAGGALNGALVTIGRLHSFIVSLGTMVAFRSIIVAQAGGGAINCQNPALQSLGRGGIPIGSAQLHYPILGFLGAVVAGWALLRFTVLGVHLRAVGDNPRAAAYAAIPLRRVQTLAFTLLGAFCALAAVFVAARQNSVSTPTTGLFFELDAIAAVVIGGTRMQGGSGSVVMTVVGVLMLGVIANMLVLLGVNPHYQGLVKGAIVIGAVLIQRAGDRA